MKSNSTTRPLPLLNVSPGRWHYNYNIIERTDTETGQTVFDYEVVEINDRPAYENLVDARVRALFTAEQEFSLLNKYNDFLAGISQDIDDRDRYLIFRQQVRAIKAEVRNLLNNL